MIKCKTLAQQLRLKAYKNELARFTNNIARQSCIGQAHKVVQTQSNNVHDESIEKVKISGKLF